MSETAHDAPKCGRGVAVIDGDAGNRRTMCQLLRKAGYEVLELDPGEPATVAKGLDSRTDVICLDLGAAEAGWLAMVRRLHERDAEVPLITMAANREPQAALEAIGMAAYDHLVRPVSEELLLPSVRRAIERRMLGQRVREMERELLEAHGRGSLIGQSPQVRALLEQLERLRDSDVAVLFVGERGSGRALAARTLHDLSPRRGGPFVALDCTAVTVAMQESEMFGHERAGTIYRGCFERADGGSLFLDEVANLDPMTQATLMRTLQERRVHRVGGTRPLPVNVRVLSATSRGLEEEVRDHRFREDLFFHLQAHTLQVAPLRERRDDIPLLVSHFIERMRCDGGPAAARIASDALDALVRYPWPGNVSELEGVVQRAMLACDGAVIQREHLPPELGGSATWSADPPAFEAEVVPLRELERREIMKALFTTAGSVAQAARRLGIGRATLYRRLSELNLPSVTGAARTSPPQAMPAQGQPHTSGRKEPKARGEGNGDGGSSGPGGASSGT